jgi:uncharacterized protein YbaR (Trm112 family)
MKIFIPTEEELKSYITDLMDYFEEADKGSAGDFSVQCPECKDKAWSGMSLSLTTEHIWCCPDCKKEYHIDNCIKIPIQTIRNEYPDLETFLAKQIIALILPEKYKPDL